VARLLLVDDDRDLASVLAAALRAEGHEVRLAHDGASADALAREATFELIVCDVNLPHVDGFTLVKRWRGRGLTVPILVLTARDSEIDHALGLELGADDYVAKPVPLRILGARITALLRRAALAAGGGGAGAELVRGPCTVDRERLEVRWAGALVETTLSEVRLMEALLERPGVVKSRSQLLEHIRGEGSVVDGRLIDTYVRRMRRKLEALEPGFDRIETVTGAGYRWRDA
jgi:DNA-binding response OmpR family regulator